MALPVHGLFYQKIYADPELNYRDEGSFDIPEGFDPCQGSQRYSPDFYKEGQPVIEEGIDDLFN